jgi:dipeptidyl aminopeptidase/acylaminoacyl peptidase
LDAGHEPTLELAATLYLPSPPARRQAPGLIVGHGAGSRRARHDTFCREACRRGFTVLALDFRGHGDSEGIADGPLEQDVLAAVRFLRAHRAADADRLCYRGSSMGGFYGLKAAPQAGFAAMVLLCPASEQVMLDAIADAEDSEAEDGAAVTADRAEAGAAEDDGAGAADGEEATLSGTASPRWDGPRLRSYFERQDSRLLAAQIDCPVLLVHARADEVVGFDHSLSLTKHLSRDTTLLALDGGTHTTAQHDPEIHRYSIAWLAAKLMH